jgi:glycosyltransferase involved in cell wall biosynthesis
VTCLCLTRNRREWLPKAIECFQAQTYPHREMLILASGHDVRDLAPNDDRSIRLVHIEDGRKIGENRNFGCDRSAGEFIAIWDDDDYSAPGRLEDQVRRIEDSGKAVTGYRTMYFTDGVRWWLYRGRPGFALGTSLLFRRSWWIEHRFLDVQIGEDSDFVEAARAEITVTDAQSLMFARVHARNTSPKNTGQWGQVAEPGVFKSLF